MDRRHTVGKLPKTRGSKEGGWYASARGLVKAIGVVQAALQYGKDPRPYLRKANRIEAYYTTARSELRVAEQFELDQRQTRTPSLLTLFAVFLCFLLLIVQALFQTYLPALTKKRSVRDAAPNRGAQ
jgi:hypothetical protein